MTCRQCDAETVPGARYCAMCGSSLDGPPTVRLLMRNFIREYGYGPLTAQASRGRYWIDELGDTIAAELTTDHVVLRRDALFEKGHKASTVRRYLYELAEAFAHGGLPNPLEGVELPHVTVTRAQVLTDAEQVRLRQSAATVARSPYLPIIVALGLECGARRGEILPARWSDIDFQRRELRLHAPDERVRTVPLSENALETLQAHRRLHRSDTDWLFPNRQVRGRHISSFFFAWKKACADANLDGLHFNVCRWTCAQGWLDDGMEPAQVSAIMGFRDPSSIQRLRVRRRKAG